MNKQREQKIILFPAARLCWALVVSGIMLMAMAWSSVDSYRTIATMRLHDLRIQELRGVIVHLDEVLTMSARMAAATGDLEWERRYREFAPQLDAAIKEAMELAAHSEIGQAAAQTDDANLKLVEMENQAFALVRAGNVEEAKAILFSGTYATQKKIYAEGMEKLVRDLKDQVAANQLKKEREATLSVGVVVTCIVLLSSTWFSILRRLNSWRKMQCESVAALTRAEEALSESQALYHSLVEHLSAGVFRKDYEGRYVFANAAFCRIIELPAEKILGKTSSELLLEANGVRDPKRLIPDQLGTQGVAHHETILQTGRQMVVEDEYLDANGKRSYYHTVKSPVFGSDGKMIGTQGILFDITERKAVEKALRESEALYLSLVDQMPAGVFRKDEAGRFVFVNSWFCRAKAMQRDQILGRTAAELSLSQLQNPFPKWRPELASQGDVHHDLIMKTGQTVEVEEQYLNADGSTEDLRVVKSAVFDCDGKITGTQGVLFDLTGSKKAEAELAHERHLLHVLLDSAPDAVYFKDLESRFIKVGTTFAKGLGMKNGNEIVGKTDFDFFTEEHARPAFEDEQAIIRSGQPIVGKVEKEILKNGRESWALTSKLPLRNKDGQIIGTFGISKDITAIKESEAKLNDVHAQLLETSRQAGMAEVATSVLHNVGNVLNSVNVSSTLVSDNIKKSKALNLAKAVALMEENAADLGAFFTNDPKGKQLPGYLAQLSRHLATEQAAALQELVGLQKNIGHIKDIVAMQQSFAKVSGVTETVQVADLVEDALRMNSTSLSRHDIHVVKEFESVPAITVQKHKVLQILVNLVRNAKQACDHPGSAEKRLILRITNASDRVRIDVIDNGCGISAENLARIFGHGFTTKTDGHGFGLHSGALAAKEMGGALLVHSDGEGRGATFTLELPLQPPTKSEVPGATGQVSGEPNTSHLTPDTSDLTPSI